jgi:hypothetical protein
MKLAEALPVLTEEWRKVHAQPEGIDALADKGGADWECLCVGWCLAKGLSIEDAYAFYREMIGRGLF